MAKSSQYHNQKQKKARAKNVKDHDEKKSLSEAVVSAEVNPLLEQIEMLKEKAVEWQEELKSKDESAKLESQIEQLEEIAIRFDTQVKKLESTDGRTAEQMQQLGKKFAYQMGQVTDRFEELEREISRDINASFTEIFESVEEEEDEFQEYLSEDKFDEFRTELGERLDKIESSYDSQEFPELIQKMDQLQDEMSTNVERISESVKASKEDSLTKEDLNQLKGELLGRIDEMEAQDSQSVGQVSISDLETVKQEILNSISDVRNEMAPGVIPATSEKIDQLKADIFSRMDRELMNKSLPATDEKLEAVKQELSNQIEQLASTDNSGSIEEVSKEIEDLKQAIFVKLEESNIEDGNLDEVNEKLQAMKQEIFEHVHKECVKQYRNIQLLFDENSTPIDEDKDTSDLSAKIKDINRYSKLNTSVSILTLATLIAYILLKLGVFG